MAQPIKTSKSLRALGLMSGSSLDGLDMAYCDFTFNLENPTPRISEWSMAQFTTASYSPEWVERLRNAPHLNGLDLMRLHADYGHYIGQLVHQFIEENALNPDLVASHGHTVFHYPDQRFTLQVGDGAAIAFQTGCTTVCDFRTQDIAAGGQGAPLAPLADSLLLPDHDFYLNLGGIANITARTKNGSFIAFDICGANQILNALAAELGLAYDDNGEIARSGTYLPALAYRQDQIPYFDLPYPKSLDNQWVKKNQTEAFLEYDASIPDKLHTACHHISNQLAAHIDQICSIEEMPSPPYSLLVSGGGAYNGFLLECIAAVLPDVKLEVPDEQIISCKEAALIALMGSLRLLGLPNCLASVTGAQRDVCGGTIHYGEKQAVGIY